jgi:release factor glutamine methyltransferase
MLLEHVLKKDRVSMYLNGLQEVDIQDIDTVTGMVGRRVSGEPIQYILGYREFMGLTMVVEPGVLIPRQDTEILVEQVIQRINPEKNVQILEWCTGSGCIAVSLAVLCKNATVTACDINDKAIALAQKNIMQHQATERVTIIKSDLLESKWLGITQTYDIICANPPYIPAREIEALDRQIKAYEPLLALDGGEDGLDFYKQLAKNGPQYLKSGGILALEIGYNQREAVVALLNKNKFKHITTIKDLAGLDRVVIGQWL